MIPSIQVQAITNEYKKECEERSKAPTFSGLAKLLKISDKTVANVNCGFYNHKPYGKREHLSRCIKNSDFEIIQGLYNSDQERAKDKTREIT